MPLLMLPLALAYETDQLTLRGTPLPDVTATANAEMNVALAKVVAQTNADTQCRGTDTHMRKALAERIHTELARPTRVPERGPIDELGFTAYAARIEQLPIARRDFRDESHLYGRVTPTDSLVLGTVGVCSTVSVAGQLVGTDKFDHFLDLGYHYATRSKWGKDLERAVDWGTATENGAYGLLTSSVFSFADLHANRRGYDFYVGLLGPESILQRGDDGCVTQTRPFDWADWLDDAYDEVLNPSVMTAPVRAAVQARLRADRETICADRRSWKKDADVRHASIASLIEGDAGDDAPTQRDELQLERLCGDAPPKVIVDVAALPAVSEAPATTPFRLFRRR